MKLIPPTAAILVPLTAAILVAAATDVSRAEVPAGSVQRLDATIAKLNELILTAKAEHRLPQLADPGEKPTLDALWDTNALLGAAPYSAKDLVALGQIYQKETAIMGQYVFSAGVDKAGESFAKYEDEVVRAQSFLAETTAAELTALRDFTAHLPAAQMTDVRKRGLKQMRLGMSQFIGALATELGGSVKESNKAIIAHTLAKVGPSFAAALTRPERQAFAASAQAALPTVASDLKPEVDTFIEAMATTECSGLCAIN